MSLLLREVALTLEEDESLLPAKVGRELRVSPGDLRDFRVVRRGIDARRKSRVLRVFSVEFAVDDEEALLARHRGNRRLERRVVQEVPVARPLGSRQRVLVVGMGPAGLFSALRLARYGLDVTLVERGRPVEDRVRDVRRFWAEGTLDPASNVQFGEGGAGTFSDGKLTTRLNQPMIRLVLETLVAFGAPEDILVQARPHVGTDCLRRVLINFRKALVDLGVSVRFKTRLTGIDVHSGRVRAGILDDREGAPCDALVLAPGHSARDTYSMLERTGVRLESKPFAMGLRVEHPAELINRIQYGLADHPNLPPADYALAWNDPATGRGVYSFCMCPGGEVVIASSEPGGMVVNGMSNHRRDGRFSNSALVVAVHISDLEGTDPLAGVRFQKKWEEAAFQAGGGDYHAPAQNLLAFLGRGNGPVQATCRPGIRGAELDVVLPSFVSEGLRRALPHFERKMRGFVTVGATLVGVEARTSAPLRILRDDRGESVSHPGLFPAGEGAGYAGGIMSAALDGLKAAEEIAARAAKGISR
ncbi:MAG: FAD-dependent monooxygenase [Desulfuromonadales bacterium]|jgi:uncharacterized FAD-dependent dehydrogenase